jgi:hypothetical protein
LPLLPKEIADDFSNIRARAHAFFAHGTRELAAAKGPLTRDEVVVLSRKIGERREAWKDACNAHLWDLYHARPNGIRNR